MKTDTIKALTGSLIAAGVVIAGMIQVYLLTTAGIISGDAALAILGPLIGGAAAWAFGRESAAGAQRAAERAVALGANTAVSPTPPPAAPVPED